MDAKVMALYMRRDLRKSTCVKIDAGWTDALHMSSIGTKLFVVSHSNGNLWELDTTKRNGDKLKEGSGYCVQTGGWGDTTAMTTRGEDLFLVTGWINGAAGKGGVYSLCPNRPREGCKTWAPRGWGNVGAIC